MPNAASSAYILGMTENEIDSVVPPVIEAADRIIEAESGDDGAEENAQKNLQKNKKISERLSHDGTYPG